MSFTAFFDNWALGLLEIINLFQIFSILKNEARERLARIKLVKESKAAAVEELIVRMVETAKLIVIVLF